MPEVLKQIEAIPATYPDVSPWMNVATDPADAPVVSDQVWARIESYIAHRWTPREVVWTVEGEGEWVPPLTPATVTASEKWESGAWVTVTLPDGPCGYELPSDGPYRITATVGGGDLPPAVGEAFRRLHEYTRGINFQFRNEAASAGEDGVRGWAAKGLQLSGAADLLRPYRRV